MVTRPPGLLSLILDQLYRWRWWLSAIVTALAGFVFHVSGRKDDPVAWVFFGLSALLLWIPLLVRWTLAVRDTGKAFREGLAGR